MTDVIRRRTMEDRADNRDAQAWVEILRLKQTSNKITDGTTIVPGGGGTGPAETSGHVLYGTKHLASLSVTDSGTSLTVAFETGQAWVNNAFYSIAAGTLAVTDNITNYVFVNTAGSIATNTSGFPLDGSLPLALVVAAAGVLTITDRRSYLQALSSPFTLSYSAPVKIGTANAIGSGTDVPHANHVHDGLGEPQGLTGATAATRYVGATASGSPTTGPFLKGDFVVDQTGALWVCTVAGTPGTWVEVGASPAFGSPVKIGTANSDGTGTDVPHANHVHDGLGEPQGLTGATAATRYVGATASGAPTTGPFLKGDFVVDQTGSIWVCTTAGTPGTWSQVGGDAAHGLLDAGENSDTVAHTPVAGDIIYANATPKWTARAIGADGTVLSASGGLPVWSTVSSLTGTFLQRRWLDKSSLHGIAATSTQLGSTPDQQAVWQFAAAATNAVQFDWEVPGDWVGGVVHVIVHYAKSASGAGDIVHRLNYTKLDVGDSLTEAGTNSDQTITVPADPQQTRQTVTWASLFTPSAVGEVWRFNYARLGGDAADTYGSTSVVIGVEVQYTATSSAAGSGSSVDDTLMYAIAVALG